jgi:flagellin
MRINTNVAALNSYNQLKNTQNNLSKSLSRLSSGKRINGAADDAAGLAISEKMGSQTRGLAQAQRNAQDGISMIQTAEGALKESHSILQRMRELSVQSANDTNTSADREEIQKEVNQLAEELTRIGETTEFNTQKLLDGSLDDTKFQIGANEGQNMEIAINDMQATALNVNGDAEFKTAGTYTSGGGTGPLETAGSGTYTVVKTDDGNYNLMDGDTKLASGSDGLTFTDTDGSGTVVFNDTVTGGEVTIDATNGSSGSTGTASVDSELQPGDYTVSTDGSSIENYDGDVVATWDSADGYIDSEGETVLDAGAAISGATLEVGGIDVSSQEAANTAIKTLDESIASVSAERSKLGAVQNRLDHTINNLNTAEENLTAAESRISDVDMAKEMMNMSKQQILSQAGTAMMAQANQLPQGVLQLLG